MKNELFNGKKIIDDGKSLNISEETFILSSDVELVRDKMLVRTDTIIRRLAAQGKISTQMIIVRMGEFGTVTVIDEAGNFQIVGLGKIEPGENFPDDEKEIIV